MNQLFLNFNFNSNYININFTSKIEVKRNVSSSGTKKCSFHFHLAFQYFFFNSNYGIIEIFILKGKHFNLFRFIMFLNILFKSVPINNLISTLIVNTIMWKKMKECRKGYNCSSDNQIFSNQASDDNHVYLIHNESLFFSWVSSFSFDISFHFY